MKDIMIIFHLKLLILVIAISFLCLFILFHNSDYVEEDYLIGQTGELISQLKYQEMLQSSASKDVYFLHQKIKNFQQSGDGNNDSMKIAKLPDYLVNKDLSVPSIFSFLPHLSLSDKSLTPAFKLSAGRTSVDVVMGIPTVKRSQQNYLLNTLQNLMDGIGNKSISKCLVVVFVAETRNLYINEFLTPQNNILYNEARKHRKERGNIHSVFTFEGQVYIKRSQQSDKLLIRTIEDIHTPSLFPEHVQSGLIEVISPSPSFYPDLEKIKQTLGDPMDRVKWRSKQNLDYAYLMMYAQSKGKYYVQMEDDVTAKKGFLDTMINFAAKQTIIHKDWLLLEFCKLGFIGKMFKTEDLPFFVQFFIMFFNDLPVDWVYPTAIDAKLCKYQNQKKCKEAKQKKIFRLEPSLFQHMGHHSSLMGKVVNAKDKAFGKTQLFFPHKNPEAIVSTTIKQYQTYSLENAYKGQNLFWGLTAAANDEVLFKFERPLSLASYLFRSGNAEHQLDIFVQTTVEALPVETLAYEKEDRLKKTSDGYIVIGEFDSVGLAKSDVDPRIGQIKAIRLKVHVDTSSNWVILNEIYLKESE